MVRPTRWLAGFTRVALAPGESARVTFRLHADRTAFTGLDGSGWSSQASLGRRRGRVRQPAALRLVQADRPVRPVGADRVLNTPVSVRTLGTEEM